MNSFSRAFRLSLAHVVDYKKYLHSKMVAISAVVHSRTFLLELGGRRDYSCSTGHAKIRHGSAHEVGTDW